MYDRSRLTRLITLALASCCATWALAAGAQARPDNSDQPAAASAAPAFKAVAGDTNKVPTATAAPALTTPSGDTAKTPNPRQVQRVLNGVGRGKTPGATAAVDANNDDTGTIALIVAIVAMLTALAAMTMIALRQTRPVMRA
jgi:hypothetical protein